MIKSARATSKKGKKVATSSLSEEKSPSQQDDENVEEEKTEEEKTKERVEEKEKEASSKKHGKGKDIAKIASVLRAQKAEKVSLRPISRAKYFDFASLKTRGWNLREYADSQGWSSFVSLQEHTYEDLVREFYANMTVKEKKNENEKFLISSVKGVQIKVTQALQISNEGNRLFFKSWFNNVGVNHNQLIIKYTKNPSQYD